MPQEKEEAQYSLDLTLIAHFDWDIYLNNEALSSNYFIKHYNTFM